MKISMNLPDEHHYSVMQHIIDGSLTVDSVEEFREILEIYPDDALLYRKYADFLLKKNCLADAVQAFDKAARLFIDQGMNLQGIVAKILQWGIEKPTQEQAHQFHSLLSKKGDPDTPLQRLWADLSYTELITAMLRLVRVQLMSGDQITFVNDPADEIYFVVSGTLVETLSEECQSEAARAGIDVEPRFIGPNDIFGNIFPLEEATENYTDVAAVTDAELVKIAKPVLLQACRKYPRIEILLRSIYKPDNVEKCDRAWQTVRRMIRFGVPAEVIIVSPAPGAGDSDAPGRAGIAVDISSGGMCVDLGPAEPWGEKISLKGRTVQSTLDLPDGAATLHLSGKIVWQRLRQTENGVNLLIGIRFASLDSGDRELLIGYCTGKFQ